MTSHFILKTSRTAAHAIATVAALALLTSAAQAQTAENLRLTLGKSIVVDYPEDVRQLSTTNPDVADVTVVTTREILVHAKGLGSTDIVVWSANNQRMFYNVAVELNVDPLRRVLRESFPNETIDIRTSGDSLTLNGKVSSKEVADRAAALAGVSAKTVVSNLMIPGPGVDDQVQLRVRFVELDRQKIIAQGINLFSTGATNTIGATATGQFGTPSVKTEDRTITTQVLNIFLFRPDLNFGATIQDLETKNVLQILAEPNLVTSSGKEASFLVGGEFPIPIVQSSTSNSITIQYKEFGIRLRFTPIVTANGTIKMDLHQEVSTIDASNAITIGGFFIPALSTRRAETNVELRGGETFMVAGLLDNREVQQLQKMPVIGDIPILGLLFKSRKDSKSNTELVMFVTPEIVRAQPAGTPAPEFKFPNEYLDLVNPDATKRN